MLYNFVCFAIKILYRYIMHGLDLFKILLVIWMKYWPTIFLFLHFYASLHIHRLPSSTIVMYADLNLPSGYLHPLANFNFVNISLHWIGNNSSTTQSYWRGAIRSHSRKRIIHRKGCRRPHKTGTYFLLMWRRTHSDAYYIFHHIYLEKLLRFEFVGSFGSGLYAQRGCCS